MIRWLWVVLLFFQYAFSYGQGFENSLLSINAIKLANINRINDIVEDDFGFIWLATDKGLYSFDGNTLTRFDKLKSGMNKRSYTTLLIDSDNRIWAGTFAHGLICIDKTRSVVKRYINMFSDSSSIADDRIKLIFEDYKNNIWVATHTTGLNRYNSENDSFSRYLPSDSYNKIDKRNLDDFICQKRDPIQEKYEWIGSLAGLLRFDVDSNKFELYHCDETTITDINSFNGLENQVRIINFTNDGMFLGTWGGGICRFDTIDKIWDCNKYETAFPAAHIRNNVIYGFINSENDYILSLYNNGTIVYAHDNKSINRISANYLHKYLVDSKAREWYVFNRNELYVKTEKSRTFKSVFTDKNISSFLYDKDSHQYLHGTYDTSQLVITDTRTLKTKHIDYKPVHDNAKNWITNIYKNSKGEFIIHEVRDLFVLKDDKLSLYFDLNSLSVEEKFVSKPTLNSLVDSDSDIWIGHKESGILYINPLKKEYKQYDESNGMPHSSWVSSFLEDKDHRIWYGSEKNLGYFDKKENRFYYIVDSLRAIKQINSIHQDDNGVIWVGEEGNVLKIEIKDNHNYHLSTYKSPDMLGDNLKIGLIDSTGKLWGSTSAGLFYFDTDNELFKSWGKSYGFQHIVSVSMGEDDSLLVCTTKELLKGHPRDLLGNINLSKLEFRRLKLFNKDYHVWDKPLTELEEINLDYKQNFLTIEFGLMDILNSENLIFEYQMHGLRDDWISLGNRNFVEFSHLNPGSYQLQIRQLSLGQDSNYSKKLRINIHPAFWQTLWFKIIIFASLILIGLSYIARKRMKMKNEFDEKLRFEKKLANVEMMALKSQMNPHFVFNCLNTIKLFVVENNTEKASRYISDFAKLLRMALNSSRIDMTTLDKELESVRLYMELEKMRFEHRFDYKISCPKGFDTSAYEVPPMLIQPFVENAIRHGLLPLKSTGKLIIDIQKEPEYLIYNIIDNGVGRAASQKTKQNCQINQSLGMKITEDRLKLIKTLYGMETSIDIYDLETDGHASGTKVIVKIPFLRHSLGD